MTCRVHDRGVVGFLTIKKAGTGHDIAGSNCLPREPACQSRLIEQYTPTRILSTCAAPIPRCTSRGKPAGAGFAVDRDVVEAPVALDNKRRYGIRRETLETEGEFGDRWTRIDTKPEDWPEMPKTKGLRGKLAAVWRDLGKKLYDDVRGKYTVVGTGEDIILGRLGRDHLFGQGQSPAGIKAVSHLPELIQKAFKTGEYNPKSSSAKNPDTRTVTIYHSAAVIDGKQYDVQLVAKRNAVGQQELMFYDMRARNKAIKEGPAVPMFGDNAHPVTGPGGSTELLADTLHRGEMDVNAGNAGADLSTTRVAVHFHETP